MKKTVILLNNAGGVGKTAAVASLAGLAVTEGMRVLCVDLDPQATLTRQFLPSPPETDIGAALRGGRLPVSNVLFNFDLVPSSPNLQDSDRANGIAAGDYSGVARALSPMKTRYDLILVDCPPSLGYLSRCAIAAADYILSPVLPDIKSLIGLQHLEAAVAEYATKDVLGIDGVFLANYNGRRRLDAEIAAKISELYEDRLYMAKIRQCNKVRECLTEWTDVATYAPTSNAATDYRRLLTELTKRLENNE